MEYLELPRTLAIGEFIAYVHEQMSVTEHLSVRYTFSGAAFFTRMKDLGLYSADSTEIRTRVERTGLSGIFNQTLV